MRASCCFYLNRSMQTCMTCSEWIHRRWHISSSAARHKGTDRRTLETCNLPAFHAATRTHATPSRLTVGRLNACFMLQQLLLLILFCPPWLRITTYAPWPFFITYSQLDVASSCGKGTVSILTTAHEVTLSTAPQHPSGQQYDHSHRDRRFDDLHGNSFERHS